MSTHCPHCGARTPDVGDAFCPECRRPLDEPPASSQAITVSEFVRSRRKTENDADLGLLDHIAWLEQRVAELEQRWNRSSLLSDTFLTRSFAVLGHFLVAYLIIVAPFILFASCAGVLLR